jgi:hypothetical protein
MSDDEKADEEIALAWINERNVRITTPGVHCGFDALDKICAQNPSRAVRIVQLICSKDSSDQIMQVLAAGPLENLLVKHGRQIIDQVEDAARESPVFRELLEGVWQREMDAAVWQRVLTARLKAS